MPAAAQDTHTRQCQHNQLLPPPTSFTLLDVLHEVPALPELLTPDDHKILSAVNKSFRQHFAAQVQAVTVTCKEDLAFIDTGRWPSLSMVIVVDDRYVRASHLAQKSLAWISLAGRQFCTIFILGPPIHALTSDLDWASSAAQQLANQMTAKWPTMASFNLEEVRLPALGSAIIAQLCKGTWSSLDSLAFSTCGLNAEGVTMLIHGDWPALKTLVFIDSGLDAKAMTLLVKGNWPLLKDIRLYFEPALDALGISQLSAANWSLQHVGLAHTPVSVAMAVELAKLQLQNLTEVCLHKTGVTAGAMSELAKASWPLLRELDLSNNDLDAAAMHHLSVMRLPKLKILVLAHASLTSDGAYWLVQGLHPLLMKLDLSNNALDAKAARHIASGCWPQLECLSLEGNLFGRHGWRHLTKGHWPLLNALRTDLSMLKAYDSNRRLGLDTQAVQECRFDAAHRDVCLRRDVPQAGVGLWPNLHQVTISPS